MKLDGVELKDIVLEHKAIIPQLVASVEHLVETQTETNKRLEEISKYLAKQAVFSSKFEDLERNLTESFKRVWGSIESLEDTQKSEKGCNSVRLLTKDTEALAKDTIQLLEVTKAQKDEVSNLKDVVNKYPSSATIRWGIAFVAVWLIGFGTYVVNSINTIANTSSAMSVMLNRDIKDIDVIMHIINSRNLKENK